MNITAIRTGLKTAIARVPGLTVDDMRDSPEAPCAIVYPDTPFDLQETFSGNAFPTFTVLILVTYNDTGSAQQQMDAYLSDDSDYSVKNAIERDQTLGGAVNECEVTALRSYGVMSMAEAGARYLSAELAVKIYA